MSYDKLNKALGITGIDDFLNDLTIEESSIKDLATELTVIDSSVKTTVQNIDAQLSTYNFNQIENINIPSVETSLNDIRELINQSKTIIKHIYENIITSDLIDSELVSSIGKLMEAAHLTIAEYIDLYKNRLRFLDTIKLKMFEHNQRKDMELYKHQLAMERMRAKLDNSAMDGQENTTAYKQEDIIKLLADQDRDD